MDRAGMRVRHDDSPDDPEVHVYYGDNNPTSAAEMEKIAKGKTDRFSKSVKDLRKLNGLSPAMKKRMTRQINKTNVKGKGDTKTKQNYPIISSGYALFDVVEPPYNLDYLAKLYEINSAHKAAVDVKVANIVGLGYYWEETKKTQNRVQKIMDDGDEEALERLRRKLDRTRGQLDDFLEDVNTEDVWEDILAKVVKDLETVGNGYIEIGRQEKGRNKGMIGYIGHIPATTMRRRVNKDGYIQIVANKVTFFNNFDEHGPNPIGDDSNPNEIIHIMNYTPTNGYYGVPDVISAKNAIAGDEFASRFNLDYFEHKAVPRYIIIMKGANLSATSEKKVVDFLASNLKGQNHRSLFVPLPKGTSDNPVELEFQAVEPAIQEASFSKYAEMNRKSILEAHRVSETLTGEVRDISLGGARESIRVFKEMVAQPRQTIIEKKLRPVFRQVTDIFNFKLNELTLTDEDTQSRIHERRLRYGIILPNEAREDLGLKGREGGDEPVDVLTIAKLKGASGRKRDEERGAAPDSGTSSASRNSKGDGRQAG